VQNNFTENKTQIYHLPSCQVSQAAEAVPQAVLVLPCQIPAAKLTKLWICIKCNCAYGNDCAQNKTIYYLTRSIQLHTER